MSFCFACFIVIRCIPLFSGPQVSTRKPHHDLIVAGGGGGAALCVATRLRAACWSLFIIKSCRPPLLLDWRARKNAVATIAIDLLFATHTHTHKRYNVL